MLCFHGTGAGLAIIKSLLDLHDANIDVKSEIEKGSEFIICISDN